MGATHSPPFLKCGGDQSSIECTPSSSLSGYITEPTSGGISGRGRIGMFNSYSDFTNKRPSSSGSPLPYSKRAPGGGKAGLPKNPPLTQAGEVDIDSDGMRSWPLLTNECGGTNQPTSRYPCKSSPPRAPIDSNAQTGRLRVEPEPVSLYMRLLHT